jgi:hypothetical protein
MSRPELNKVTTAATLTAAIVAAIEAASQAGLSKDDVKASIDYVTSLLED